MRQPLSSMAQYAGMDGELARYAQAQEMARLQAMMDPRMRAQRQLGPGMMASQNAPPAGGSGQRLMGTIGDQFGRDAQFLGNMGVGTAENAMMLGSGIASELAGGLGYVLSLIHI